MSSFVSLSEQNRSLGEQNSVAVCPECPANLKCKPMKGELLCSKHFRKMSRDIALKPLKKAKISKQVSARASKHVDKCEEGIILAEEVFSEATNEITHTMERYSSIKRRQSEKSYSLPTSTPDGLLSLFTQQRQRELLAAVASVSLLSPAAPVATLPPGSDTNMSDID